MRPVQVPTLVLAAALAAAGCQTAQPLPPSEATAAVEETRAAAGLPPGSEPSPPEAPAETAPAETAATETPPEDQGASEVSRTDGAAAAAARGEAVRVSRLIDEKEAAKERGAAADPTVVQIGPDPADGEPRTLAEAAAAAREKRRREGRPRATVVIDNDNLAAFGAQGQVTVVTPGTESKPEESATAADAGAPGERATPPRGPAGPRDEAYWRGHVLDIRTRWADAAREVERLEGQADQLRWDFYAEDDPYYRDERIKPEWDRVLDELRRARQDVRAYREELAEAIEQGRRAGALPGWLREGVELEPEEPESPVRREPGEADVEEPTPYGRITRPEEERP